MSESPRIEVRCPRCDVSFAVGTRRCLHCGGPTVEPEVAAHIRAVERGMPLPVPAEVEPEVEEETPLRRGPRALTLLWIVLALAASLYRSCTTPG